MGFGPHYGYQQHVNPSDFAVWTFAYDVNGVATAEVKYRVDLDGINPLTETDNDTYAGGPGVGDWQSLDMEVADVPTGNVTGNGDVDFFILPDVIADLYHATITGIEDQLVDYYVEITDVHGNTIQVPTSNTSTSGIAMGAPLKAVDAQIPRPTTLILEATTDDGSCLYDFTVQVDMSEVPSVSPNGVHIAGAFQGWNAGSTPLVDFGNGIWSAAVEVPAGAFQCKFINGNAWGTEETVPGLRHG